MCLLTSMYVFRSWQLWLTNTVKAFPFDPNPNWSHFYASGKEIHDYLVSTTKKWNLDRDIRFNTRLEEAHWQHDTGQWKLKITRDGEEKFEFADVLISGQGILKYVKQLYTAAIR